MRLHAGESVVGIRPYRHGRGLEVAEDFTRSFHRGVHSFEMWSSGKVKVFICSSEPEVELRKRITSFYPAAELYSPEGFPVVEHSEFCAAVVHLKKPFHPIRTDFVRDPLNALVACMTGHDVVYQVMFTPAPQKYTKKLLEISRGYQAGRVEGWLNPRIVPPGKVEHDVARAFAEKAKSPCYLVEVRICAFGEGGEGCEEVVESFGSFFELFRTTEGQGFEIEVAKRDKRKQELFEKIMKREFVIRLFRKKSVLSAGELALLAHLPGDDVAGDIEWTFERKDISPPADGFHVEEPTTIE